MEVYRRMGQADCQADLQQLTDDLRDIFGKIPRQAQTLLDLAELKIMAGNWAIKSIILEGSDLVFTLGDLSRARNLFADAPGAVRYAEPTVVHLRPPARYLQGPTLLAVLRKILHNAP